MCFPCLDIVLLCFACCLLVCVSFCLMCFFFFGGDFLQNSQHETKILKKTVTKALKIGTNGGHTGKSMPRNVITLGSPKGLDRCDRVLLCVDSVNFSLGIKDSVCKIAIFLSFRFTFIRLFCPYWMNQSNPTHLHSQFPSPHAQKNHVVIHFHQGHPQT